MNSRDQDIKFDNTGIFSYDTYGFTIGLGNSFCSIKWTDIERLIVYKVDLMTTDEICMDIVFDNKKITVTESTKGWDEFTENLKSKIQLNNYSWKALVSNTPFAHDLATIYERADRKMPSQSNFFATLEDTTKEEVNSLFQKHEWVIRKSSWQDVELENSWAELVLKSDNEGLLLHGLMAHHPDNVTIIKHLFDSLNCSYKLEFYENDLLVEEYQKDM